MLNKVELIGNLGQDPEMRQTTGGTPVCTLSVATNEHWTDRETKEKKTHTEWHRVIVFGKQAESCGKFLNKGRMVYVEGVLRTRKWTDRDDVERWTTEIKAKDVKFLPSGGGNGDRPPTQESPTFEDDDVPF